MKVLFLAYDEVPSFKGASTHILAGLRGPCREHDITLVTLGDTALPASPGFTHFPFHLNEPNYLRRALMFRERATNFLERERWDLVHFRGPFEGMPAVRRGCPTVYEVNAFPSIELRYHFGRLPAHIVEKIASWERECCTRAAALICPSNRIKECILQHAPAVARDRITVLPNGYDRPPCVVRVDRPEGLLAKGVYLGTLAAWQGVHWMLRTFRELLPQFSLDIYAPYQKVQWRRVRKRIARLQLEEYVRLYLPLHRHVLAEVLPRYDFAVAPLLKTERNTVQGCCPLKILDYLAHGLPTVAADLYVVRELIQDPNYPFFFHPGSTLSCKAALTRIKADLADTGLRERMIQLLADRPDWNCYGRDLTRLYNRLAP